MKKIQIIILCILVGLIIILTGVLIWGSIVKPCKDWDAEQHCHTEKICTGGIMIPGFCRHRDNVVCSMDYWCVTR